MDPIIARHPITADADLALCLEHGVAYQRDMSAGRVLYDDAYLEKCSSYEGNAIAKKVNEGRCSLLLRYLRIADSVLDIGVGSGAFMRAASFCGFVMQGFDVMPEVVRNLRFRGRFCDQPVGFDGVCMWDSLEHMEDPGHFLRLMSKGSTLFVSVPVFADLRKIRESKHYRPGEHLYYWTAAGLIEWAHGYGFRHLETSNHECEAGRESIGAFVFRRDAPMVR